MSSVTFNFKQDADTVFAFVSDPDETRKRSEAFNERDIRVDVRNDGGAKTVSNTRLVTQELPGFLKKLFNPTNTVVDKKEWRDDGDGATKTAKLTVDVLGTPTALAGTITIAPSGSGCTYTIDFKASAKVPLIRKKVEAYIEKQSIAGMREEFEYNQRTLDSK